MLKRHAGGPHQKKEKREREREREGGREGGRGKKTEFSDRKCLQMTSILGNCLNQKH